jgi:hypothetical protein
MSHLGGRGSLRDEWSMEIDRVASVFDVAVELTDMGKLPFSAKTAIGPIPNINLTNLLFQERGFAFSKGQTDGDRYKIWQPQKGGS